MGDLRLVVEKLADDWDCASLLPDPEVLRRYEIELRFRLVGVADLSRFSGEGRGRPRPIAPYLVGVGVELDPDVERGRMESGVSEEASRRERSLGGLGAGGRMVAECGIWEFRGKLHVHL